MERRQVGKKILGFALGAGGVAIAVFMVLPWFEAPDQAAGGPQSGDAIVEDVPARCSKPETEGPPEIDDRASDTPGAMTIPFPLVATAAESPERVLPVTTPEEVATWPLDGAPAHSIGLPAAAPPGAAAVTAAEATAEATAGATAEGFEEGAEIWDGPVTADPGSEEVRAVEASVPEEPPRGVSTESAEGTFVDSIEANNGVTGAPASVQSGGAPSPGDGTFVSATGRVMEEQPHSEKALWRRDTASESQRPGLPRLEFEMPGDLRIVDPSAPTEDTLPANEAVAAKVERRSEFSTRHLIRSEATPTVEGLPRSNASDIVPPAEGLPRTAGNGKAAADDTERSDPVTVQDTLRGVMGYRLPLVSRQELPDQVVSGVLIPAHTTYVILQPGYWELVGVAPGDVEALRAVVEKARVDQQAVRSEPNAPGWNPFRLFRRKQTPAAGN